MQTNPYLAREADSLRFFRQIFESSRVLHREMAYLRNAATTNLTVLITGERGVGKEQVARAVHRLSHRSSHGFVRINCAAIQPQLIVAGQLSQGKGRRSRQAQPRLDRLRLAEGGTIFLQGIDDLVPEAQLGLVNALRDLESEYNDRRRAPRVIASTCRDLQPGSGTGTFLQTLFVRLNQFAITLPPLRERKEDIPALARHFLSDYMLHRLTERPKSQWPVLTERAMNLLQSYPWPGNTRELQSVMERFAVLSEANVLSVDADWIPWEAVQARLSLSSHSATPMPNETELLDAALMEMLTALPGWGRSIPRYE